MAEVYAQQNPIQVLSVETQIVYSNIELVGSPLKYLRFWDTLVGGDGTCGAGNEKTINWKSYFLVKKSQNFFKIGYLGPSPLQRDISQLPAMSGSHQKVDVYLDLSLFSSWSSRVFCNPELTQFRDSVICCFNYVKETAERFILTR